MLERQRFPRFSIGESLLAHCMEFIEEAGLMDAVRSAGFQLKNGAAFACGNAYTYFDFREKFSPGPGTTYQVQRAQFDKILADEAERQGVQVRYEQEVTAVDFNGPALRWTYARRTVPATRYSATSCSTPAATAGVLARLCGLERPSSMPPRKAIFTHIEDRIDDPRHDRDKILISVHPLSAASGTG